jgi:predicted nucleic acid-binding protein
MAKTPRIYWDACAWIALIAEEKAIPTKGGDPVNRYAMCLNILEAARKGKYEIVTSAFTLAEVCKSSEFESSPTDNLAAFFERSYILVVPVNLYIGRRAQVMQQDIQASGFGKLKPADAVHLASAEKARVMELHTFDDKILALDGKILSTDGTALKVCRPTEGVPLGPLFDAPKDEPEPTGE